MPGYVYPTAIELNQIAQDLLPVLTLNDPLFDFFEIETKDTAVIAWEQRDNYAGLQQVRGLGGQAQRVARIGAKRYMYEPGYYGEYIPVNEQELMQRRPYGVLESATIDITDLVLEAQQQLLTRRLNRIRAIAWTLITQGTFSITGPLGGVLHTDTYPIQTYAGSAWGTPSTGTPLQDFRGCQLLSRGHSVNFGPGAIALMNRKTANKMFANTNQADLGGKRLDGLAAPIGLEDTNKVYMKEGLPTVQIFDDCFIADGPITYCGTAYVAGNVIPYIPDNKTVIIGQRVANSPVAAYYMVRHISNPNMEAGPFMKVVDNNERPPRSFEVHDGHNGGPVIFFPSAVIIMTTT